MPFNKNKVKIVTQCMPQPPYNCAAPSARRSSWALSWRWHGCPCTPRPPAQCTKSRRISEGEPPNPPGRRWPWNQRASHWSPSTRRPPAPTTCEDLCDGGVRDFNSLIVHEDQDGELANELLREKQAWRIMVKDWQTLHLRGDVDELETLPGLVDADHREGAEDLHHRRALACDVGIWIWRCQKRTWKKFLEWKKYSLPGWPFLSGGGREGRGVPNSLAALDLRGLMFASGRLEGSKGTYTWRKRYMYFPATKKSYFCTSSEVYLLTTEFAGMGGRKGEGFLLFAVVEYQHKDIKVARCILKPFQKSTGILLNLIPIKLR